MNKRTNKDFQRNPPDVTTRIEASTFTSSDAEEINGTSNMDSVDRNLADGKLVDTEMVLGLPMPDSSPGVRGQLSRLQQSQYLEKIIEEATPHIKRRLRYKGVEPETLEDLTVETLERFLRAIQRREERAELEITDTIRYALAVADTVFDDHIRQQRPNWCRLKRRVLYLIDTQRNKQLFKRWKYRSEWIAGFTRWIDNPFRPNTRYHTLCTRPVAFCHQELHDNPPKELPLERLMAHLFHWLGTPLELDELTTRIAELQEISDNLPLSIDELAAQNDTNSEHWIPPSDEDVEQLVLDSLENNCFCETLRQLIATLPVRQRIALLLGMTQDELLLIAPIGALASILEMPRQELKSIWLDLPLDDSRIATRLSLTNKQVSNLRKCARERLERNLKPKSSNQDIETTKSRSGHRNQTQETEEPFKQ